MQFAAIAALLASSVAADVMRSSAQDDIGPFVGETWYSGLVDLEHDDDIFYWWFESREAPEDAPLVLWLTGGPGCASEIALFYENGPYQFEDDGKTLKSNPYSWNSHANLLYVDQPVGTGFSHAGLTHLSTNEEEIAENMAQFMIKFLAKYPQLEGKDFYITGESYAGHYIPAITHNFVFKHKEDLNINFKGMAIGNGLVDPYLQYPEYDTFSLENELIGKAEYVVLEGAFKACQALIKTHLWPIALEECQLGVTAILGLPTDPRFNVYDIREKCDHPPLCYNFDPADNLLGSEDIKEILGVKGRSWTECNTAVHTALLGDWMLDLSPQVTDILEAGVDTLVYSGDKDFICNWRGGEKWTHDIAWTGHADFADASYNDWTVGSKAAGALKEYKNLKFLRVFDAGHMVPMNQPAAALEMLDQFTKGGSLMKEQKPTEFIQ
jgi:cathepsin A (carboxypeptidase C)